MKSYSRSNEIQYIQHKIIQFRDREFKTQKQEINNTKLQKKQHTKEKEAHQKMYV